MFPAPRRSNTALSVAEKLPASDSLNGEVSILMQGTLAVYSQLGWSVTSYQPQASVIEKESGICWRMALTMLPIPLLGLAVLIGNLLLRRIIECA